MKSRHHFDPRKGEPPYWLRSLPEDLEVHRRMVREHERVHGRSTPPKDRK